MANGSKERGLTRNHMRDMNVRRTSRMALSEVYSPRTRPSSTYITEEGHSFDVPSTSKRMVNRITFTRAKAMSADVQWTGKRCRAMEEHSNKQELRIPQRSTFWGWAAIPAEDPGLLLTRSA